MSREILKERHNMIPLSLILTCMEWHDITARIRQVEVGTDTSNSVQATVAQHSRLPSRGFFKILSMRLRTRLSNYSLHFCTEAANPQSQLLIHKLLAQIETLLPHDFREQIWQHVLGMATPTNDNHTTPPEYITRPVIKLT
jgi:hypothetical protein